MVWNLVIPALASIGGSLLSKSSSDKAARTQENIAREQSATTERLARENRDYAQAAYAPYERAGNRAQDYLDALDYGQSGGAYSTSSGGGGSYNGYDDIPPDQVGRLQEIWNTRPDLQQQWNDAVARGEQPFENNPLQFVAYATQGEPQSGAGGITRADAMAQVEASAPWTINEGAYTDSEALAGELYNRELGYLGEDLGTRQGYTNDAIAARTSLNDTYQTDARNRTASMLAGTGQVGKAARYGAETADQLNTEFQTTVRGWQNEDYDPYATGRMQSYGAYGNRRDSNLANRTSGRQAAYADWRTGQDTRVRSGRAAVDARVTGQNAYTDTAINANSNASAAAAQAAERRAAGQQTFYGDVAEAVGGAYGGYAKGKPAAPAAPAYAAPSSTNAIAGYSAVRRPYGLNYRGAY